MSEETYEELRITTMSTVLCTRHLLALGFHFVLTGKCSSDDVESLFSTIRQLNGSNDQTDAYAALLSLQKVLVTGINVGSVIGSVRKATKLALLKLRQWQHLRKTSRSFCFLTWLHWRTTQVCLLHFIRYQRPLLTQVSVMKTCMS